MADTLVRFEKFEGTAHAGEHAQREDIDLHESQRVDIILVPFDDLAVVHRGGLDRHQLVDPVTRQHEAAGMLRKVPRRVDQGARSEEHTSELQSLMRTSYA